jgi:alkanesulfonate monooxygenase
MKLEIIGYVPLEGDGRYVGTTLPERPPTFANIARWLRAHEEAGFDNVLLATSDSNGSFGRFGPVMDAWTSAAALAVATSRIKLLLAIQTGLVNPALAAKMCATLDHIGGGRFTFNFVSGSNPLRGWGDYLDHDARYRRTAEYLTIVKGLWTQREFSFEGEFYRLENVVSEPKPLQVPYPPVFFSGLSPSAQAISAREADVQLIHTEPPEKVGELVASLGARAAAHGRCLQFGVRLLLMVRPTQAEALAACRRLLERADPELVARRTAERAGTESTQIRRHSASAPGPGAPDPHLVGPNLWGGLRTVRSGAGVILYGTPDQVIARMLEYVRVGVSHFVISGFPIEEEATIIGREVIGTLRQEAAAARVPLTTAGA